MHRVHNTSFILLLAAAALPPTHALAVKPPGIIYESEAISSPQTAWQQNKRSADRWMLWTTEQDIEKKRSRKAVLASPTVAADRESPEDGAPPLHSRITNLKPGTYFVYASSPGRPLAYSTNGKTWFKHAGRELFLGTHKITDGQFELWVDDRYAHPTGNPGPGYYDYIRFFPVPASAKNVQRHQIWSNIDNWLRDNAGFAVPATEITDRVGFEPESDRLKGQAPGHQFTYTVDRPGTFNLAVIMNDDVDGIEHLLATLNNKEIGTIIADRPRGGITCFSFTQPLQLAKGDKLAFTCKSHVGCYRVYKLCFAQKPIVPPPPAFENVTAWWDLTNAVFLCWTTTAIVETGLVEFGLDNLDKKTPRKTYTGRNHRIQLPDFDSNKQYQAKIVTEFDNKPLISKTIPIKINTKRPPTKPQTIQLTIPEPTDHPRKNWPVTIGIPFPKSMLAVPAVLRLFNPDGQQQYMQAQAFSRWPDNSVKWATYTFMADTTTGNHPARYKLESRPKWSTPNRYSMMMTAFDEKKYHLVTNQLLALATGTKAPGLLRHVERGRQKQISLGVPILDRPIAADLKLQTDDGTLLTSGPPTAGSFKIEARGPFATMVSWTGPFIPNKEDTGWRYGIRLTLYKDQPTAKLSLWVWNDHPHPTFHRIKSLQLHAPIQGGALRGSLEAQPLVNLTDDEGLWLLQDKDNHFQLRTPTGLTQGTRATGVAIAQNQSTRLTAMIDHFWQTYPSGLAVKKDGLHIQLLPPLAPDTYDDPESRKWFAKLYAWFDNGNYVLRAGQVTRHDLYLRFDRPADQNDAKQFAAWWSHPPLPQPPPDYLCATGVLSRPIFPKTAGLWDEYEALFDRSFANLHKDREQRRTYGWMHFGDWFGERTLNFGNSEYDLAWACALQWMRTGHRPCFDRGLEMARHHSSTDTLFGSFGDDRRALVYTHCFNHLGTPQTPEQIHLDRTDKSVRAYLDRYKSLYRGAMDPQGHIYQEGNWLYAALTGDPWLRHVAQRVSTHQAEKLTPRFNFTIERSGGWPLINAVAAYNFSGNPFYLNAARLMIERCLQRQDPVTGGWLHRPPIGETGGVAVQGGKAFAVGILSYGILRYLDLEPLDRPDVRQMLIRGADWLMNESWNPGKGFRYISNSEKHRDTGGKGVTCLLNAELIAFAYEQTRDPKYLKFWKEMVRDVLPTLSSGMGKSFTMTVRHTVFGLDRVRQFNITKEPNSP